MAISGFGRGKAGDVQGSSAPKPSGTGGGFGNLTAFIDQGSEFEGKLCFKDTVRIDGTFRGEIESENTLIVGETGQIQATICSTCVVISGHVDGDILSSEQVVLHKTATVDGDITTPSLVMEEGATLNGRVNMSKPGQSGAKDSGLKAISGGNSGNGGGAPNAQSSGGGKSDKHRN